MATTFQQIISGAAPTGGDSGATFASKINSNFTLAGTTLDSKADMDTPIVSVTASKTLALTDKGTIQNCASASAIVVTIPLNSVEEFPLNSEILLIRYGTGDLSVAPASGVTVNSADGQLSIEKQYGMAMLKKIDTNEWVLIGMLNTVSTIVSVTTSKTLTITDKNTLQQCSSSGDIVVTIPLNSTVTFPINTEIQLMRYGTGSVSVATTVGVTLNSAGGKVSIREQFGSVILKKISTNEWVLFGVLDRDTNMVTVTTSKTLALTDEETTQKCTSGSATTITIPFDSAVVFPNNTEIDIVQYGDGTVSIAPATIAGVRDYTIATNCVNTDTITISTVTFTATTATQDTTNFIVGATATDSATNFKTALNANSTISALYTATSSGAIVTLTEKTSGGGNTPTVATYTGTVVITNALVSTSTSLTLNSLSSKKDISGKYGKATLKKVATDEWLLTGSLA